MFIKDVGNYRWKIRVGTGLPIGLGKVQKKKLSLQTKEALNCG